MNERRVIASFRREDLPEGKLVPVVHPPGHLVVVRVGDRVFAALSKGGNVQVPLAKTFFSKRFGVVFDRFGISWMVLVHHDGQ